MRLSVVLLFLAFGVAAMVVLPLSKNELIHGVSVVNPPNEITSDKMGEVKRINAEWVAVIPYGFSRSAEPGVTYDHARQWWGERTDGTCQLIKYAKEHQLKVMLKPHVWVMGEGWTGNYTLSSENDWKIWERDFSRYILNHARVADSLGVEMLCVGTEYRIPAKERPDFWRGMIKEIRKVYTGKITYASNWDNYEKITWWDEVDYIGVDAYFPLVEGEMHPAIDEIEKGWEPIKEKLAGFSKQWNKPILFTEYGFQSANGAAGKHWELSKSSDNVNEQLQADAYEATYRALMNESWFAGGFLWKWHFTSHSSRWRGTEWTPQNKPAEKVIAKWYGNH